MAGMMNKHLIPEVLPAGMTVEEIEIPVPWGHLAGRWWGPRNKQPIIAVHGWQENAGAWDNLIPLLPASTSIFCIDMPGHGLSSHYPAGMTYYVFWDGISILRRIIKHFKWQKVTLMGHSLGGSLTFMYAASFPDDVDKLICIDVASPADLVPLNVVEETGLAIDKILEYENLTKEKIPCLEYDQMINLVCETYEGSISRNDCKVLMKRGMAPASTNMNKKGYYLKRDFRLKEAILAVMSIETALEYASKIKCKVLNIRALYRQNLRLSDYMKVIEKLKQTTELQYEEAKGTHHVHLNTPENIAPIIKEFLKLI